MSMAAHSFKPMLHCTRGPCQPWTRSFAGHLAHTCAFALALAHLVCAQILSGMNAELAQLKARALRGLAGAGEGGAASAGNMTLAMANITKLAYLMQVHSLFLLAA